MDGCEIRREQQQLEDAIMGASERKRMERGKRNGESGVESNKNNKRVVSIQTVCSFKSII